MSCMPLMVISFSHRLRRSLGLHQFARDFSVYAPVEYISNIFFTFFAFSLSKSIPRVYALFLYPTGAQPGHTPLRSFCLCPRFTFSRKLSETYLLCPNAILSMNNPCGVGSNQKVGNFRERIKPRSTK